MSLQQETDKEVKKQKNYQGGEAKDKTLQHNQQ